MVSLRGFIFLNLGDVMNDGGLDRLQLPLRPSQDKQETGGQTGGQTEDGRISG